MMSKASLQIDKPRGFCDANTIAMLVSGAFPLNPHSLHPSSLTLNSEMVSYSVRGNNPNAPTKIRSASPRSTLKDLDVGRGGISKRSDVRGELEGKYIGAGGEVQLGAIGKGMVQQASVSIDEVQVKALFK